MDAGRKRAIDSKMKGCLNLDNKLTDIYLPRKCDFTDKIITSKDHASIQLSVCDVTHSTFRSMKMAPSTSASPTLSPSPGSSAPLVREMLPSKESLARKSLSDSLDIFHSL